jgi:GNAT superfamily N-acetyltransferase
VVAAAQIRDAEPGEEEALERLQLEASLVWDEYREALLAHPDAVELPPQAIQEERVRVAVAADGELLGFSVVLPGRDGACDLDGLFVDPAHWGSGVGRLLVSDAATRARAAQATRIDVIANPNALGFYERVGFVSEGTAPTRFGPGVRMSLRLSQSRV